VFSAKAHWKLQITFFIECEFAKEVWYIFLNGLNVCPPPLNSIDIMFSSWKENYPYNIMSKSIWQRVWIAAPKYVCWKLWLARNEIIFNNTEWSPAKVAEQAKNLLLETLNYFPVKDDNSLRIEERTWLDAYTCKVRIHANIRPNQKERWQIRDSEERFQQWWKSQGKCTIFFDGASKGNPGKSGAGGVIFSPNGKKKNSVGGLD
jgi:hypothetical protein